MRQINLGISFPHNARFLQKIRCCSHRWGDTARKLLTSAEQRWEETGFDFNEGRLLIVSVNEHLGDQAWLTRLLNEAAERCKDFAALRAVGKCALTDLSDKSTGKALANGYYRQWESKLDGTAAKSLYDYTKLASVVSHDLSDTQWAKKLIEKAAATGKFIECRKHLTWDVCARYRMQCGLSSP